MPRRSALAMASVRAALMLVAVCLAPLCAAQMTQPLEGQGVDPVTLGFVNRSIPVYVSVSLEKLTEVDEVSYTFSAVFSVVMTWRDPTINSTVKLITFLGNDEQAALQQRFKNCTKWAVKLGVLNVPDCEDIMEAKGSCERPCFMGNGYACCDSIWIPGINIANILFISQDSIQIDRVWLFGGTVGPANGDWSSVYRVVRVQADFSNEYNFKKFPFDAQLLKFQMSPIPPANFYLVPSVAGVAFLGPYGIVFQNSSRPFYQKPPFRFYQAKFDSNQVTGWSFPDLNQTVKMVCKSVLNTSAAESASQRLPAMSQNSSDPLKFIWENMNKFQDEFRASLKANAFAEGGGLTCDVCVEVLRVSNYYISNAILPVVLAGLLSFTVVFARPHDLDVRLGTLVTLFLALVAIQFIISDQLPRTQYLTAFTVLVLCTYGIIVLLIIESLIVFYISILEEKINRKRKRKGNGHVNGGREEGPDSPSGLIDEDGADLDGMAPPLDEPPSTRQPGTKGTKGMRLGFLRSVTISEDQLFSAVGGSGAAVHIAGWFDNISLLFLGAGYVTASVTVFIVFPQSSLECSP